MGRQERMGDGENGRWGEWENGFLIMIDGDDGNGENGWNGKIGENGRWGDFFRLPLTSVDFR